MSYETILSLIASLLLAYGMLDIPLKRVLAIVIGVLLMVASIYGLR